MSARTRGQVCAAVGNFIRPIGGGIIAEARGTREYEENTENAIRLALCWNTLEHLDGPTVSRLAKWLERYNGDELNQMMDEETPHTP